MPICKNCGRESQPDAQFCGNCGKRLIGLGETRTSLVKSKQSQDVVSPDREGWDAWDEINRESKKANALADIKSAIVYYLILVGIAIFLVAWGEFGSPILALLVDILSLVALAGGIYSYQYWRSRCPSCRKPWSQITVARKVVSEKEFQESHPEMKTVSHQDPDGTTSTTQEPTGKTVYIDKKTTGFLYYMKCKYCGYDWNKISKETVTTGKRIE
jgi:hypothetical protein